MTRIQSTWIKATDGDLASFSGEAPRRSLENELEFIRETREQCHEEGTVPEAPRLGKGLCLAAVANGRKSSRQPGQGTMLGQESQSCVEHRSSIPGVGLDWQQPSLGQEPQDDVSIGPLLSRSQSPDLCNEMVAH